ncbi:putative class-I aminoacyl-tRNA synthetase family protein [Lyophyllum shimeji]|uniref:Glutamate--tRNA ligase, mitochondrial n=1 Tax=Lyophyllum shimeji TaxID=47721 RepID=A0A9P3UMI5_LYOSH|nr:putative class-I aminoacyl-tRNA synthetase family protein [Lyophyllum shimeji]
MALLRFAPSPTGPLHLGGLRMALYNHLYARKVGGKWIMRVEDTDATRFVPGSVDGIRKALEWAGLEYDYGPGKDGPHAPYFQSERLDLYRSYAKKLLDSGHAYRCFCSPDKLAETRERLARTGSNSTYDKTCLHLTEEEVARKVRAGEKSVVRLNDSNLPDRPPATDLVFGNLKDAHASLPTDPILLKTDLFPTYHLASVVDDHEMGITHVLRGEEWLLSYPLHLDLYAALNLPAPQFAHIPILLNSDGTKMSKRKGDVQVVDYIRSGWEPQAVLNWLALAGWGAKHETPPSSPTTTSHPARPHLVQKAPDSTTLMTLPEMIDQFELSALTQRSSSLDAMKLEYLNKHHLMRMWSTPEGLQALAEKAHDRVKAAFPASQHTSVAYIKSVILALEGRLTNLRDIALHAPFFFVEPDYSSNVAQKMLKNVTPEQRAQTLDAVVAVLEAAPEPWDQLDILNLLHEERERLDAPYKVFMTVLRHALCGQKDGPGVADVMRVLGRDRTLNRLRNIHIQQS